MNDEKTTVDDVVEKDRYAIQINPNEACIVDNMYEGHSLEGKSSHETEWPTYQGEHGRNIGFQFIPGPIKTTNTQINPGKEYSRQDLIDTIKAEYERQGDGDYIILEGVQRRGTDPAANTSQVLPKTATRINRDGTQEQVKVYIIGDLDKIINDNYRD